MGSLCADCMLPPERKVFHSVVFYFPGFLLFLFIKVSCISYKLIFLFIIFLPPDTPDIPQPNEPQIDVSGSSVLIVLDDLPPSVRYVKPPNCVDKTILNLCDVLHSTGTQRVQEGHYFVNMH